MNAAGWFVMLVSVGGVTAFFAWCIQKVLRTPGATEHLHGERDRPPDLEPPP